MLLGVQKHFKDEAGLLYFIYVQPKLFHSSCSCHPMVARRIIQWNSGKILHKLLCIKFFISSNRISIWLCSETGGGYSLLFGSLIMEIFLLISKLDVSLKFLYYNKSIILFWLQLNINMSWNFLLCVMGCFISFFVFCEAIMVRKWFRVVCTWRYVLFCYRCLAKN